MKIKDLIEHLKTFPEDTEVHLPSYDYDGGVSGINSLSKNDFQFLYYHETCGNYIDEPPTEDEKKNRIEQINIYKSEIEFIESNIEKLSKRQFRLKKELEIKKKVAEQELKKITKFAIACADGAVFLVLKPNDN